MGLAKMSSHMCTGFVTHYVKCVSARCSSCVYPLNIYTSARSILYSTHIHRYAATVCARVYTREYTPVYYPRMCTQVHVRFVICNSVLPLLVLRGARAGP